MPRSPVDDVVLLRDRGRQRFVRLGEILWIAAADDYTEVQLTDGSSRLCLWTMRDWEARLPLVAGGFARIHGVGLGCPPTYLRHSAVACVTSSR